MLKAHLVIHFFSLFCHLNLIANPDEDFANDIRSGKICEKPNWSRDYTERYIHYLSSQKNLTEDQIDLAIYKCSDLFFHYCDKEFREGEINEYGYALYLWGRAYLLKGNFNESLNFLSQGITVATDGLSIKQSFPYLSSNYYYRALIYQVQGRKNFAIEDLIEACQAYNGNLAVEGYKIVPLESIYYQTAMIYLGTENISKAYENFMNSWFLSSQLSPNLKTIHYYAGTCALQLSLFQAADYHLTESLLLQPSNVQMDTEICLKLIEAQKAMGKPHDTHTRSDQMDRVDSKKFQKKHKTVKYINRQKKTSEDPFSNINLNGIYQKLSK